MIFRLFVLRVCRGIAIGRAVLGDASRLDVAHYFGAKTDLDAAIERLRGARDEVAR